MANENVPRMRIYDAVPRGSRQKTQRYAVSYPDGRERVKMLTEHSAEILADQGLNVRRMKGT
jgi:hypothetical protein